MTKKVWISALALSAVLSLAQPLAGASSDALAAPPSAAKAKKSAAAKAAKKGAAKAGKKAPGKTAAGKVAGKAAAKPAKPTPEPVDVIEDRLFQDTKKDPWLLQLKQAYAALEKGNTSVARKIAGRLKARAEVADYALWILATCELKDAEAAIKSGGVVGAPVKRANALLARIGAEFPYSPLTRVLPRFLAQGEILTGRALCGTKDAKSITCRKPFENAFQRLMAAGELGLIRPAELGAYSGSCSKKPDEICLAWMRKFLTYYPKASPEMKALVRPAPDALDLSVKPAPVSRATQTYRAPESDVIAFDSAMGHVLEGKSKEAIKEFRQFLDEFPKSGFRFRARFWLAKSLAKEGKEDEARKAYEDLQKDSPLTYYGLMASYETNKPIETSIDTKLPLAIATDPFLTPLEITRIHRAESLIVAGARELAAFELKDIKARENLSSPFLLYLTLLNDLAGNHSTGFSLLTELIQRNYEGLFSSYGIRLVFPTTQEAIIRKVATEQAVDPILVLSLVKQESAFDASAMSWAGALGLMQLMPFTAVDVNPTIQRADLVKSEENLQTGVKYLKRMLNRFNGNIVYALASYNAGPGAVDRWIRATPNGRSPQEFIEAIPYKETREYVASILRNYFWYSHRMGVDLKRSINAFWAPSAPALTAPPNETPDSEKGSDSEVAPAADASASPSASPSVSPSSSGTPSASPEPTGSPSASSSPSPSATPSVNASAPASASPQRDPSAVKVPKPKPNLRD